MGESKLSPFVPDIPALVYQGRRDFKGLEFEGVMKKVKEALLFEEEGNMISGVTVMHGENLFDFNIAEKSNLVRGGFLKWLLTAAGNLYKEAVKSPIVGISKI